MNKLKYFSPFNEKANTEEELQVKQNNISDSSPDAAVALFPDDMGVNPMIVHSIPGYNFIMASGKIDLWLFEGLEFHLIGIGSPFGRNDYCVYLSTLPEDALLMLQKEMQQYGLKESENAILFGINGTVRVLNADSQDMFYIAYPGDELDYEMTADINDSSIGKRFRRFIEDNIGYKMGPWISKKYKQLQNNPIKL